MFYIGIVLSLFLSACLQKENVVGYRPEPMAPQPVGPAENPQVDVRGCRVQFKKNMSYAEIAQTSYEVHRVCHLTEEQIVQVVQTTFN